MLRAPGMTQESLPQKFGGGDKQWPGASGRLPEGDMGTAGNRAEDRESHSFWASGEDSPEYEAKEWSATNQTSPSGTELLECGVGSPRSQGAQLGRR